MATAKIASVIVRGVDVFNVRITATAKAGRTLTIGLPDEAELWADTRVLVRAVLGDRLALAGFDVAVAVEIDRGTRGNKVPRLTPSHRRGISGLDLPIALAVAAAIRGEAPAADFAHGCLSLRGAIRTAAGGYLAAEAALAEGLVALLGPDSPERMPRHRWAETLDKALRGGRGERPDTAEVEDPRRDEADLADLRLTEDGHRRLVAALTAGLGITLYGKHGAGLTMLARRIGGLLGPTTADERRAIRRVASAAAMPSGHGRPFRAPHHTVSVAGLAGTEAGIGEVQLASAGVLYLDMLAEFSRPALEALDASLSRTSGWPPVVAVAGLYPETTAGHLERIDRVRSRHCPVWITLAGGEGQAYSTAETAQAIARARASAVFGQDMAAPIADRLAAALAGLDGAETVTEAHRAEARACLRPALRVL